MAGKWGSPKFGAQSVQGLNGSTFSRPFDPTEHHSVEIEASIERSDSRGVEGPYMLVDVMEGVFLRRILTAGFESFGKRDGRNDVAPGDSLDLPQRGGKFVVGEMF